MPSLSHYLPYRWLHTLLLLSLFSITTAAKDIDVLILSTQESDSGLDISEVQVMLQTMLSSTPGFEGSSSTWLGEFNVDSLLEAYYDTRYASTTHTAITSRYDYVILADWYKYLRWAPEITYEGVNKLSRDILEAGGQPLLLMSSGESNADLTLLGENAYRVANGCGVQVLPLGYALADQGLFVASLNPQQAYLIASGIYKRVTGLSATALPYAPVANHSNLALAAETAIQTQAALTHYTGSRHNQGMVRYRTLDLNQSPTSGNARYIYTATSTEAGINAHLGPLLSANGFTPEGKFISASSSDTKSWTQGDFDAAKPHFDARTNAMFLVYARGAATDANPMVAYNQSNLLALTFDRHHDNIGTGSASTINSLDNIEVGAFYDYHYHRNYNWSAVPFHIGISRLYREDNTVIVSTDGVHVTTPFYNLICSMLLTSALGQDLTPTAAILSNPQSLKAFNIGQELIKELAYISETSSHIPDSNLDISAAFLPIANTSQVYSRVINASGGTGPYTWEEISSVGLPNGISLSTDGVLSGTPSGDVGLHTLVCRVTDANGCIRKRAFQFLVQDSSAPSYENWAAYMFDNSGLSLSQQGKDQDPEGDGLMNFFEFATGAHPTLDDIQNHLNWQEVSDGVDLKFRRAQGSLRYTVEATGDFVSWLAPQAVYDSNTDSAPAAIGEWQNVATSFDGETRLIYRLNVHE